MKNIFNNTLEKLANDSNALSEKIGNEAYEFGQKNPAANASGILLNSYLQLCRKGKVSIDDWYTTTAIATQEEYRRYHKQKSEGAKLTNPDIYEPEFHLIIRESAMGFTRRILSIAFKYFRISYGKFIASDNKLFEVTDNHFVAGVATQFFLQHIDTMLKEDIHIDAIIEVANLHRDNVDGIIEELKKRCEDD